MGQARQSGGRRWLLRGWQCAGGAVGRGGLLLYAGIGQAALAWYAAGRAVCCPMQSQGGGRWLLQAARHG